MATWNLELRDKTTGNIDGYDKVTGTLAEAYEYSREWLREMATVVSYPQEIVVIDEETEEIVYQGNLREQENKGETKMTRQEKLQQAIDFASRQVALKEKYLPQLYANVTNAEHIARYELSIVELKQSIATNTAKLNKISH